METAQGVNVIGVAHTLKVYFERMPDSLLSQAFKPEMRMLDLFPFLSEALKHEMKPEDLEPDDRLAALNCVLQSADSLEDKLTAIRDIVQCVDQSIFKVMSYFFKFLHRVSLHAEENKMTSANLAIVFEGIIGSSFEFNRYLIQLFIDHHKIIFGHDEQMEDNTLAALQSPLGLPEAENNLRVSVLDLLCYNTLTVDASLSLF